MRTLDEGWLSCGYFLMEWIGEGSMLILFMDLEGYSGGYSKVPANEALVTFTSRAACINEA